MGTAAIKVSFGKPAKRRMDRPARKPPSPRWSTRKLSSEEAERSSALKLGCSTPTSKSIAMKIRLLRHTAAPAVLDSGSYEVRFSDGRKSMYFYFDDNPGRRSITHKLSGEEAERKAKELARTEQDKLK